MSVGGYESLLMSVHVESNIERTYGRPNGGSCTTFKTEKSVRTNIHVSSVRKRVDDFRANFRDQGERVRAFLAVRSPNLNTVCTSLTRPVRLFFFPR